MPCPNTRFGLAAAAAIAFGVLAAWLPAASAGEDQDGGRDQSRHQSRGPGRAPTRQPADADALQVLADVVLIEAQCRTLSVDYDRLFAFAESKGIASVDIMPTGPRRAAFEAAYRARARDTATEGLCGPLAAERAALIPGLFSQR